MRFLYVLELVAIFAGAWVLIFEVLLPLLTGRRLFPFVRSLFGATTPAEKSLEKLEDEVKEADVIVEVHEVAHEIEEKLDSIKGESDAR